MTLKLPPNPPGLSLPNSQNISSGRLNFPPSINIPPSNLLSLASELVWTNIGSFSEIIGDPLKATFAYEAALKQVPFSETALKKLVTIYWTNRQFALMSECIQRLLTVNATDGHLWSALGRCFLELNEPQKSYTAFQQALLYLKNPKDVFLWFGIGLLYESFVSEDLAEEAYLSVIRMHESNPALATSSIDGSIGNDKNAIKRPLGVSRSQCYYRLGLIYGRNEKTYSLGEICFRFVLSLSDDDISVSDVLTQLAILREKVGDLNDARTIAEYLRNTYPKDGQIHRLLGWILTRELELVSSKKHNRPRSDADYVGNIEASSGNSVDLENRTQETDNHPSNTEAMCESAVNILLVAIECEPNNAHAWYLLGRYYSSRQLFQRAYEAYQQAIYRDGRQPSYWCSIGILYFRIGQYKDALDGYIRSIHLNSKLSTVWANLGILYEHCNNQVTDAMDAYSKAVELDPGNLVIRSRYEYLKSIMRNDKKSEEGLHDKPAEIYAPEPVELHSMTIYPIMTNFTTPNFPVSSNSPPQTLSHFRVPNGQYNYKPFIRNRSVNTSLHNAPQSSTLSSPRNGGFVGNDTFPSSSEMFSSGPPHKNMPKSFTPNGSKMIVLDGQTVPPINPNPPERKISIVQHGSPVGATRAKPLPGSYQLNPEVALKEPRSSMDVLAEFATSSQPLA